jgi:hypothetical protein
VTENVLKYTQNLSKKALYRFKCTRGRFFGHFLRKITFRGKFRGISLEKLFFKTFPTENSIFSQHFLGKIFRGIFPKIFPGKNVQKIGPRNKNTKK